MSKERRTHQRHEIIAQIRVRGGRVNYLMPVTNVSLSGLFIATDVFKRLPWFRKGQSLEMNLFVADSYLDNIRVTGHIVRIVESDDPNLQGFGVQFDKVDAVLEQVLLELVDLTTDNSIHPPPPPISN